MLTCGSVDASPRLDSSRQTSWKTVMITILILIALLLDSHSHSVLKRSGSSRPNTLGLHTKQLVQHALFYIYILFNCELYGSFKCITSTDDGSKNACSVFDHSETEFMITDQWFMSSSLSCKNHQMPLSLLLRTAK